MGDSDLSSDLPEGQTLSGLPRPLYTYPPRRRGAVRKDGFDQARRLSRALAQVGEGDFASLLSRRMDGREQKRLDTAGRLENAKATYRLRRGAAKCIKGRVIVRFTIDEGGKVCSPEVLRSLHPLMDAEALRIVRAMPRWEPARDLHHGKPMPQKFTLPIMFKLPEK
jgi:TonB family protein